MKSCIFIVTAIGLCSGRMKRSSESLVEVPGNNGIFFLGDGMGITTMMAARLYKVGEEGYLTINTKS